MPPCRIKSALPSRVKSAPPELITHYRRYQENWPAFAREILGVKLDKDQDDILRSVQTNARTIVKSGHARGKDFMAAVASLCFLYLNTPSKVISTAPTGRQVTSIMLSEAKSIWQRARVPLGGTFNTDGIKFADAPDWFMLGFKAGDKATEDWTGFHSQNILVVVTEASGINQETFDAIEGLLTGNSRLLLVLNPNRSTGEAYKAFKSPLYAKFTLNCLDAPNVLAKRIIVPGQVDWGWVNTVIQKPGWVTRISPNDAKPDEFGDFEWDHGDGQGPVWYRPSDLARVKILGLWPREPETQLIPLAWVEAAQQRYLDWRAAGGIVPGDSLRLGGDVAGMGADMTVFCPRRGVLVQPFECFSHSDHMATVGRIKTRLECADAEALGIWKSARAREEFPDERKSAGYIDTIGEGAGVHSRLIEQGVRSVSVKFSQGARGLTDLTGERKFRNMRAYCWWAIRDALDPELHVGLMLPPGDEIVEDLTSPGWSLTSQGDIVIEDKDDIKKRLGRSPDYGDALANTFYPYGAGQAVTGGAFAGLGVF